MNEQNFQRFYQLVRKAQSLHSHIFSGMVTYCASKYQSLDVRHRYSERKPRGLDEIKAALTGIKIGISCLTPENLASPWLLYEAGGLTKTIDDKTRLCTYLLAGLTPSQIPPPLGMFQHTQADRADTRKLIHSLNNVINEDPLADSKLDNIFDKFWPDLEQRLASMPTAEELPPPTRNETEMIAEMLDLARAAANSRQQTTWMDQFMPVMKKFLPLLEQLMTSAESGIFTLVYHDRPKFSHGTVQQRFEKFHTMKAAIQRACNLMELPEFHDPFIMVANELLYDKNAIRNEYAECKAEIHNECGKQSVDLAKPENAFIVGKFTPQGILLTPFADIEQATIYVNELSRAGNTDIYMVGARP